MREGLSPGEAAKLVAAKRAVDLVEPGMRLGLGTGSTAAWFVRLLAQRERAEGLGLACVATSSATARLAAECGLAVRELDAVGRLDLTVDGADEVDGALDLVKGGGAALLREKIVAGASRRLVVIADDGKRVARLGAFPLPVEVVRFGWRTTQGAVERALALQDVETREVRVRMAGDAPLVTDEGHHILDLHLGAIRVPGDLAVALSTIPGVVEHGLFLGIAEAAIFGRADGGADVLSRPGADEGRLVEGERVFVEELMRSLDA